MTTRGDSPSSDKAMSMNTTVELDIDPSPGKRRRTPTKPYRPGDFSTINSTLNTHVSTNNCHELHSEQPHEKANLVWSLEDVPFGPTFYPTVEDMSSDPLLYLDKIRNVAERYGICRIVPPDVWKPPFALNVHSQKRFQTKDQSIHRLQEGISFGDGEEYTFQEYQKMASEWSKEWKRRRNYSSVKNNLDPNEKFQKISQATTANTSTVMNNKHMVDSEDSCKQETEITSEKIMTPENLEQDYWDIVEGRWPEEVDVDYGNDVDTSDFGSGFPLSERGRSVNSPNFSHSCDDKRKRENAHSEEEEEVPEPVFGTEAYYKETYWNLNNIPNSKNSVLRHVKVSINGINVPWLYFGCLFSTFCWHNEDNYMYSINYHHKGAPKQWYGVPGTKVDADGVERVFKSHLWTKVRDVPDLIHHITTSFSPRLLNQEGVRVCKLAQNAGEFVVTFPRSFHCGYSMGPNVGEAVNFAFHDWIPHAVDANERYRIFARPSVFSHDRLVCTMAHHINELGTKEICDAVAKELRRLMGEELLLRSKLLKAGVRDVSEDVKLPINRLDQLDEESADYDDKRLCHSCKHICFFSAVACECSETKVSCLRHSHYMCRCSIKQKYLLVWMTEKEMEEAINKVEKQGMRLPHGKPLEYATIDVLSSAGPLEDTPDTARDRLRHKTYEVPIDPICCLESEVPQLVLSDTSVCSIRSQETSAHENYQKTHNAPTKSNFFSSPSSIDSQIVWKSHNSSSTKYSEVTNEWDNSNSIHSNSMIPSSGNHIDFTKPIDKQRKPLDGDNFDARTSKIKFLFTSSDITSNKMEQEEDNSNDAFSDDFSA